MHFLATATVLINFDKLPDAAIEEVAASNGVSGDRAAALKGLQDLLHRSTYADLEPIIARIKLIAEKHGVPEAVQEQTK